MDRESRELQITIEPNRERNAIVVTIWKRVPDGRLEIIAYGANSSGVSRAVEDIARELATEMGWPLPQHSIREEK